MHKRISDYSQSLCVCGGVHLCSMHICAQPQTLKVSAYSTCIICVCSIHSDGAPVSTAFLHSRPHGLVKGDLD